MLKPKSVWCQVEPVSQINLTGENHPVIEQLILNRRLATPELLTEFFHDKGIEYSPFLMKDMTKSVERIRQAIEREESILIYGDYDADGVTATAILVRCLRDLGAQVQYYIPNRFYEGYGPNEDAFMQAVADGFKVVLTVDNGISGIEEAKVLAENGVDLIITDHHQAKETLPQAFAILHPELDPDYPFDLLAGAGVALKLAQALKGDELHEDYYAIAALGTIGDIVKLIDENRSITKRGLNALRETNLPGLKALMDQAGTVQSEFTEVNAGFEICPRLNAPGRMEDAIIAVDLLVTDDEQEAVIIAKQIEQFNNERKKVTQKTVDEALNLVDEPQLKQKKVVILYASHWHEGILGIVAGKLAKRWKRAVMLLTDDHEGLVKGSARAIEGYHLFELLAKCEDLVVKFGGHALAAGLSLEAENIQLLENKMNDLMAGQAVVSKLTVDLALSLKDVDLDLVNQLECLAPFGEGNRTPIIKLQSVRVKNVKKIGNKLQHLKLTIYDQDTQLEAVAFNQAELAVYLTSETSFDFVGELNINEWNGNRHVQLMVSDLKCDEFQIIDLRNRQLYEQFKDELTDATLYSASVSGTEEQEHINNLVIDTLPDSKELLLTNLKKLSPDNVILVPYQPVTFATREKFVTVYKEIKQHAPFTLNKQIMNYFNRLGMTKNELLFILQVFFEIELVIIKDATVSLTHISLKRELSEAPTYQSQMAKQQMLEFFELSTGLELKEIFSTVRTTN